MIVCRFCGKKFNSPLDSAKHTCKKKHNKWNTKIFRKNNLYDFLVKRKK